MRRMNSRFDTTFQSEPGLDGINGTYYGYVEMDQYYCMAIAEGYDGEGGRESAKLAVDTAIEAFMGKPGMSAGRIGNCLKKAHRSLREGSVRLRLKAGIVMIVSDYTRFRYGACGNVMVYGLRNAGIFHQSVTQTVYQTMVDAKEGGEGAVPEGETRNLYQYLGGGGAPSISGKMKLQEGDLLLAATEGFWSRVGRVEVLDAYESMKEEGEFLGDLQELYLRGSVDDIPCCCLALISIKKVYKEKSALKKKIRIWCITALIILAVVAVILYVTMRIRRNKQEGIRTAMETYQDIGDRYMNQNRCQLASQEYEKALEEGKRLSNHEERLEEEKAISGKMNISSLFDSADTSYEARDYAGARADYKQILELINEYPELHSLIAYVEKRLKLTGTGIEIEGYMQSAALKEAAGDLTSAYFLYERAAAMLRIIDDPERLQQVQLAQIRLEEQLAKQDKEEQAKARDQVIVEADEAAAVEAMVAGDYELAVELYLKVRDSYVAMEENEKAKQVTAVIQTLQKQLSESGKQLEAEAAENKNAAMNAFLAGDLDGALENYKKVRDAYLEAGEEEKAKQLSSIISLLEKQRRWEENAAQPDNVTAGEDGGDAGPGGQEKKPGPGTSREPAEGNQTESQAGPGAASFEDTVGPLLNHGITAVEEQDIINAIELYMAIRQTSLIYGEEDVAAWSEDVIAGLAAPEQ